MSVTLKDVAKAANVSEATVSRVINNDTLHPVNKDKTQKVIEAISMLDYKPNTYARGLRKNSYQGKTSYTFGALLVSNKRSYNDNVFYHMLMGIQSESTNLGISLAFNYCMDKIEIENIGISMFNNIDGLIIMGRTSSDVFDYLKSHVPNITYVGLNHVNHIFDEIICNSYDCTISAIKYLDSLKFKSIGFIGQRNTNKNNNVINEYRFSAYCDALTDLDIEIKESYIIDTEMTSEQAYTATLNWIDNNKDNFPEAFFASNDNSAIGAIKAFREKKIKIPEDISIISIDNIEMASYCNPMLTTVEVPYVELGKYAVRNLRDQIESKRKYPIRITLPYKLIVRDSCKKDKNVHRTSWKF